MAKLSVSRTAIYFWFIVLLLTRFMLVVGENEKEVKERTAEEMFRDAYTALTKTSFSSLEKIKGLINELQTKYFPPNIDFRSRETDPTAGKESATEKMTTAAEKSFGKSKEAVEESAKTAAKAVGDVVQKTATKVAGNKGSDENIKDEL